MILFYQASVLVVVATYAIISSEDTVWSFRNPLTIQYSRIDAFGHVNIFAVKGHLSLGPKSSKKTYGFSIVLRYALQVRHGRVIHTMRRGSFDGGQIPLSVAPILNCSPEKPGLEGLT